MSAGIYKITNRVNGKVYIGQSGDFRKRFRDHKSALRAGRHHNDHLQNSWNKHGERNFVFGVVEMVFDKEQRTLSEKRWINLYDSHDRKHGYNIIRNPEQPNLAEETKAKISCEGNGRSILTKKQVKSIIDLILENKLTYMEIGDKFNVSKSTIKQIKLGGRWSRFSYYKENKDKIKCLIREQNKNKKIGDDEIKVIKNLRNLGISYQKIAKKFGVSKSTVRRYCLSF